MFVLVPIPIIIFGLLFIEQQCVFNVWVGSAGTQASSSWYTKSKSAFAAAPVDAEDFDQPFWYDIVLDFVLVMYNALSIDLY